MVGSPPELVCSLAAAVRVGVRVRWHAGCYGERMRPW